MRAPLSTPETRRIPVGDFGVATFYDGETLSAEPEQRFSYCADKAPQTPLAFRLPALDEPTEPTDGAGEAAGPSETGETGEVDAQATEQALPLVLFPGLHRKLQLGAYDLGLLWDFPFLFSFQYKTFVSGRVRSFGVSVPFGLENRSTEAYGSAIWSQQSFDVGEVLLKCTRYCTHPTFDSAGVYNVLLTFEEGYEQRCYRPRLPGAVFGQESAPNDP